MYIYIDRYVFNFACGWSYLTPLVLYMYSFIYLFVYIWIHIYIYI